MTGYNPGDTPGYCAIDGAKVISMQIYGGLNNDGRFRTDGGILDMALMEATMPHGKEGFSITLKSGRYSSICVGDRHAGNSNQYNALTLYPGHSLMGKSGVIRFDNLLRKEATGLNEARLANIQVNVAGDYIVVSADTWIQGVELLDINGRTIKAAGGNCLNVADVNPAVYLVRVHINGRTATQKVIIGK